METVTKVDEDQLLTLARAGDEGAFNALIETHRAVIDVLTLTADGKISAVTAFVLVDELCVDPAAVFARFGLPAAAPAGTSSS
jgi:hypothetical protein